MVYYLYTQGVYTMSLKHITVEQLKEAVKNAYSAAETARTLNLVQTGNTCTRLKNKIIEHEIDISHWTGALWSKGKTVLDDSRLRKYKSNEEIFAQDSNASATYVRSLILKKNLLEYKCQACLMEPIWNGKQLNFQLDHINGDRKDHRLDNLRWICPNCHSQTETFCSKNSFFSPTKKVSDEDLIKALNESKNKRQALIKVGLNNGKHYDRIRRLEKAGLVKPINTFRSKRNANKSLGV